jgi:hypothetical protein
MPPVSAVLTSLEEEVDAVERPAAEAVADQQLARTPQSPTQVVKQYVKAI